MRSKNKILSLVIGSLLIIGVIIFLLLISTKTPVKPEYGYTEQEIHLEVGDYIGLNLDTDKIYFGTVNPGGHSKRQIQLDFSESGFLYITLTGDLSDIIFAESIPENVTQGVSENITLYAYPPKDWEFANYTSKLHVYVLKDKNELIEGSFVGYPLQLLSDKINDSGSAKVTLEIVRPEDE